MNVLVTGGCGFLGSNIASSYLDKGAQVCVIDALFRNGSAENLKWLRDHKTSKNLSFYQLDLAEKSGVDRVFQKHAPFDYICHLGGQVAMTTSLADPERDFKTNALGTFNVLEAMRRYAPEALLAYSSTNKVYGDMDTLRCVEEETRYVLPDFPNGMDENLPLDFASPYGCSKGAADQYVHDWFRNYGLKTAVFRHSSIYGGRQFSTIDQGWIGWFCQKAIEQQRCYANKERPIPFTISGTGKQVRDVLHAEDLIRLYHCAYENRNVITGQVFNIGGGMDNSLSLLELFRLLEPMLGLDETHPLTYTPVQRRQSDQNVFVANIGKIKNATGWQPAVSSTSGINKMLNWIEESVR